MIATFLHRNSGTMFNKPPQGGFISNHPLACGLKFLWCAAETYGTVTDVVVGRVDTTFGHPTSIPGGRSFDGTNDYIVSDATLVADVFNQKTAWTIISIHRLTAGNTTFGTTWQAGAPTDYRQAIGLTTGPAVSVTIQGVNIYGYTNVTENTSWHMYAGVYNGNGSGNSGRLKLYVDAVEKTLTYVGTVPATSPQASINTNFSIGVNPNASVDPGDFALVAVFDRALLPEEVRAWYLDPFAVRDLGSSTAKFLLPDEFGGTSRDRLWSGVPYLASNVNFS